jgi:hypothetical protein
MRSGPADSCDTAEHHAMRQGSDMGGTGNAVAVSAARYSESSSPATVSAIIEGSTDVDRLSHPGAAGAIPPSADPPLWRARWTQWPCSGEPLLILASPGRPYPGAGFGLEHADFWYCQNLGLVSWNDGKIVIPPLATVHVHVGGPALHVCAVHRVWLDPSTKDCGADDYWTAAHLGRTILGVAFSGPRSTRSPEFEEFRHALHAGKALIGDVEVIADDDARWSR